MFRLTDDVVSRFRAGPQYHGHTADINSLQFTRCGDRMVTAADDDRLVLYHVHGGPVAPAVFNRPCGVDVARFAPDGTSVLHVSPKSARPDVRYFSLNRNMDIHSYTDHTSNILSLCISPTKETFASGSIDGNVLIWDLRLKKCLENLKCSMRNPVIAFDQKGLVLAIGTGSKQIDFFDTRAYSEPMWSLEFSYKKDVWTDLQFSPDNTSLLISTTGSKMILLNSEDVTKCQTFDGNQNIYRASFSPDSQYLFGGSVNGSINVWKVNTGQRLFSMTGGHRRPVKCIQFNPKYMMIASSCDHTTFWMHELNINFKDGVANIMDYEYGF